MERCEASPVAYALWTALPQYRHSEWSEESKRLVQEILRSTQNDRIAKKLGSFFWAVGWQVGPRASPTDSIDTPNAHTYDESALGSESDRRVPGALL